MFYVSIKKQNNSILKQLRQAAGISQRELARRIDVQHTNIQFWENTGKIPRSDLLKPMAEALGCSVEQILGEAPKRKTPKGGKMRQLFEEASKLPRRQQEKIVDILKPFVRDQSKVS